MYACDPLVQPSLSAIELKEYFRDEASIEKLKQMIPYDLYLLHNYFFDYPGNLHYKGDLEQLPYIK